MNSTVASLYAEAAANFSSPVGSWPSQSTIDSSIWTMWLALNLTSAFDLLWQTWGTGNFTFTMNFVNATGVKNVTFGVHWVGNGTSGPATPSAPNSNYEYWVGALPSGVVTGPTTWSGPLVVHAAEPWGGYELNAPGVVSSDIAAAYLPYIQNPYSTPLNVPSGVQLDPFGAVWTGVSPSAAGNGGLLQTGYQWDPVNPSVSIPTMWWELLPGNSLPYPGAPNGVPLTWEYELEFQIWAGCFWWGLYCWNLWGALVYSPTTFVGSEVSVFMPTGYSPEYVQGIFEAPQLHHIVQQVPEFSDTEFHWYGIHYGSAWHSADSIYNSGHYHQYNLTQMLGCTSPSTWEQFYNTANSAYVGWQTSAFDFNCAH